MNSNYWFLKGAEKLGLVSAYSICRRHLTGSQIAILMYHRVSPNNNDMFLQSLTPESFEKQIQHFQSEFTIIDLEELVKSRISSCSLPKKVAVITFDDGYKDNYTYAYPILQKYDAPATIFIATGYINTGKLFWWDIIGYLCKHTHVGELKLNGVCNCSMKTESDRMNAKFQITQKLRRLSESQKWPIIKGLLEASEVILPHNLGKDLILSWSEIERMAEGGITFGAHTVNHSILTKEPLEVAKKEIVQSKKEIEDMLGREVSTFSYPDGCFNNEIIDIVRKSGFTCAAAVSPLRLVGKKDNPYCLHRIIPVENSVMFKAMLAGLIGDMEVLLEPKKAYF